MSKPIHTDFDFQSANRVRGLLDPALAQDAATKAYVDASVEGLAWKDSVRVAATTNINLAAPGATIDGIAMAANDRFLAPAQTTGADNGIYIYNGSATPATRALDMNSAAEVEQAVTTVEEGSSAGSTFRQTAVNVTLGTTTLSWTAFGTSAPAASTTTAGLIEIADQTEVDAGSDSTRAVTPQGLANWSGRLKKYSANVGDGSATLFQIDHNLGTRDVTVEVYKTSGNYDTVLCDVTRPTANRVTLTFGSAPAASAFRVVIEG